MKAAVAAPSVEPAQGLGGGVLSDVFRIAFEHSAAGISVASPTGDYLHANRAFCEFVGHSIDELRRLTLTHLVHPDDRSRQAELTDRFLRGELSEARWECRYVHRSGLALWALLTTTLVRDEAGEPAYVVSQVIDITDRKLADEALLRAEARSSALINAMQDVILVMDAAGTYLDIASSSPERLFRPADQLLGRRLHDVFPKEQADTFLAYIQQAIATHAPAEAAYELDIRGQRYFFEATISPLPDDRVVFVARDVSARRRAEQALRESEDQLRQAQKMEAVGQLAGGIAHDFNNLLMAIMSNAELASLELAADSPAPAVLPHIEEIKHASRKARSLTQQLLAFSRKQVLQPRVIDLNVVVRDAEQILRRLIGEHIELTAALEPRLGQVLADPGQVSQMLVNLAVNARDAMPKGGQLTIESSNRDIGAREARALRGLHEGRYVALEVRDTGIGMDEATRARVFEPFFTTKPPGQGTGLGLSTVYGIVKQSGGYIAVDSERGRGTKFTVLLPRVTGGGGVDSGTGVVVGGAAAAEIAPAMAHGTVLLVEDEAAVREATKRMLRKYGFDVLEAKHGEDALLLWRNAADRIDVVLTDVVMPTMGGADLVRALRQQAPRLRVVFMSGYTQGTIELSEMDEADTRFLPKPFTADQLVGTLRELTGAA